MGDRFRVEGVSDEGTLVADIKEEVPESLICQYFRPKSSKSGWKYNSKTTVEEQDAILSLYRRVYESEEMPNKELTLQFARGLIYMSMGKKVDWCQFRHERRQYREGLRKKKLTRQEKTKKDSGEGVPGPSTIGKKRCTVLPGGGNIDFPCELNLSVKAECEGFRGSVMGKKVVGKGRGALNSPFWIKEDLEVMAEVIQERSELVKNCEHTLKESTLRSGELDDKLRRAKMLRSDRLEMISDGEIEFGKIKSEELALRAQIEAGTLLLAEGPNIELSSKASVDQVLLDAKSELEAVDFRRLCAEATRKRSSKVVSDCDSAIVVLHNELEISRTGNEDLSHKVLSLKSLVVSMGEQLRAMEEGGGVSFFPRPITGCPAAPLTLTHTLNVCPVCCLWYSCWDYVPASCGHCYHPWCLAEHSKTSTKCLLSSCEKPFLTAHKIALGIRPVAAEVSIVMPKKMEFKTKETAMAKSVGTSVAVLERASKTATLQSATSFVSSWSIEAGDKEIHLSQSSESNLNAEKGLECGIKDTTKESLCYLCNRKAPALHLVNCGHALFCFGCINGRLECPFCFERITGWEPLPVAKPSSLVLLPNGVASNSAIDITISSANGKRKLEELKDITNIVPSSALVPTNEVCSDSDEDLEAGLLHWCGEDVFNAGGARSMQLISPQEPEIPSQEAGAVMDVDRSLPFQLESGSLETGPECAKDLECGQVFKRKRGPRRSVDTLNHTRIVEKALTDILGSSPILDVVEKASKKSRACSASSLVANKARRKLVDGSKTTISTTQQQLGLPHVNSGTRVKYVPARFKDQ